MLMKKIEVLIPTYNRLPSLCVTLTSLCYQQETNFDIIISDQSDAYHVSEDALFQSIVRLLSFHGHDVTVHKHVPRRGMAEQRNFLLEQSRARYCMFLDDDMFLEPFVLANLAAIIEQHQCGFTGNAPIGLSYSNDERIDQQCIEFWSGKVLPEEINPHSEKWQRHKLHNAANVLHVQKKDGADSQSPKPYKIAWVGGCVLFDTEKLRAIGGFGFWKELPELHCGEDVFAQLKVMANFGGCGVLPSGAYHQELLTTLPDRSFNAPVHL